MRLFRYLVVLSFLASCCQTGLLDFQGFGSDMQLRIDSQVMVSSQQQFANVLRSNILLRFRPGLKLNLTSNLVIKNLSNIYISGPVSLNGYGIYIQYSSNIIIKDIRLTNSSIYGILIYHSSNVIVDHCTIADAGRASVDQGKCIDITQESKKITVSYNILAYTNPIQQLTKYKGLLAANFLQGPVENVSIHHNLFYCIYQRSPEISSEGLFDMRENVIFNYTEYGSRIRNGAYGNFIGNWYIGGKKDPLVFLVPQESLYSVSNTWKFNCVQNRTIQDFTVRDQYPVPGVRSRPIKEVIEQAGCLSRQLLQLKIAAEVSSFL